MGRESGKTPWHATALKLHADGLTASKIVEALSQLPAPPGIDAVKKLLARSKKDPAKALQIVAQSGTVETPPLPPMSEEDGKTLVQLFVAVEKHRVRVLTKALNAVEEFLDTPPDRLSKEHQMKFSGALETLRVLKTNNDVPNLDQEPGGSQGDSGGSIARTSGGKPTTPAHRVEFEVVDPQVQEPQVAPDQA